MRHDVRDEALEAENASVAIPPEVDVLRNPFWLDTPSGSSVPVSPPGRAVSASRLPFAKLRPFALFWGVRSCDPWYGGKSLCDCCAPLDEPLLDGGDDGLS